MAERRSLCERSLVEEADRPQLTEVSVQQQQQRDHSQPSTNPITASFLEQTNPITAFTFPTLGLDGSLPDLASTPTPRRTHSPTPPAALSSLGAKLQMAEHDIPSDTSLDAQYDFIDDVSDISTDDHETASLASTEREEGQLTPEDSIVDLHEEAVWGREDDTSVTDTTVRAENHLLDSYMSEELETPRQSLIQAEFDRRATLVPPSPSPSPASTQSSVRGTKRVLFISENTVDTNLVSDICLRIASCLVPEEQAGLESISRLINLPDTPSSDNPVPALFLRVADVELLVEPSLMIQALDKLHTPDLIIFYLTKPNAYSGYIDIVKSSLRNTHVPNIVIRAPGVEQSAGENAQLRLKRTSLTIPYEQLFDEDDIALRAILQALLLKRDPVKKSKPLTLWETSPLDGLYNDKGKFTWQEFFLRLLPLFAIILAVIIKSSNLFELIDGPGNPNAEADLRRACLTNALTKMNYSDDATKVLNMDHLVPYPLESAANKHLNPPEVRFQGLPPNRILISLPIASAGWLAYGFPTADVTHVHRSEKNPAADIRFNQTMLLSGIYDITIPADDAYGVIVVNMTTKAPRWNFVMEHHFGNRILRRKTYAKASMELSKAMNKDVAVARKNVRSLREKFELELSAGATATKNVTSELAVYIARDLRVLANTALSVFGRAAAARKDTAAAIQKEVAALRKDLARVPTEMKKELVLFRDELVVLKKDFMKRSMEVREAVLAAAAKAAAKTKEEKKKKASWVPGLDSPKNLLGVSKERAGRLREALAARRMGMGLGLGLGKKDVEGAGTGSSDDAGRGGEFSQRLRSFFKGDSEEKKIDGGAGSGAGDGKKKTGSSGGCLRDAGIARKCSCKGKGKDYACCRYRGAGGGVGSGKKDGVVGGGVGKKEGAAVSAAVLPYREFVVRDDEDLRAAQQVVAAAGGKKMGEKMREKKMEEKKQQQDKKGKKEKKAHHHHQQQKKKEKEKAAVWVSDEEGPEVQEL